MQRRELPLTAFLTIIIATGVCIVFLFSAYYMVSIGEKANQLYGPASPELRPFQYYRLSYQLVRDRDLLLSPLNPDGLQILFTVELGETASSALTRLQAQGIITDQNALRRYLIYTGFDTQLQAGDFLLSPTMTPVEVITAMLDSTPQVLAFSVLPGWRLEEIAASLPTSGLSITPEQFLSAANNRPIQISFIQEIPNGISLEGYFMPGTYSIDRDIDSEGLVAMILERFDQQVTLDIRQAFEQQGMSLHQAITLASIVEKEAIIPDERPQIASVFFNRLALGMLLETDPTVQYAIGYNHKQQTWWTNPLSLEDLNTDSPFNTYLYPGLPPTPIANPSLSSIRAVAFPAKTPYLYFRAACDRSGLHRFAETFEEHKNNACP